MTVTDQKVENSVFLSMSVDLKFRLSFLNLKLFLSSFSIVSNSCGLNRFAGQNHLLMAPDVLRMQVRGKMLVIYKLY